MRQVTLYSANKQQVMSYDMQYIKQYHYPYTQDILSVRNSDTILDKQEVEVKHLPIERFCWSDGKEIFAAFDEELREIIGCSQEKFERDVQAATNGRVNREFKSLLAVKDELKTLHNLSVWRSLGWSVSKLWRRCNV